MRVVVQRVSSAACRVDGVVTGEIGRGLLVFLGIEKTDTADDLAWLVQKVCKVRVFEDEAGKMNLPVSEIGGGVLVISQFTLYGHLKKGTRPSFNRSAPPDMAVPLYEAFIEAVSAELGQPVPSGIFGADMKIDAANDGPVTLVMDSRQRDF